MKSASLPKESGTARACEQPEVFWAHSPAPSPLAPQAPADRLNAAKGAFVGIAFSAGLWAAILGCMAILRR